MITMGALAIPSWYATGRPVLTFNLTIVALTLIAAFAMYLLVTSWTGVPAAGIVAGLLFAFHPGHIGDIAHPGVWEATWTAFGLWFGERLFARGRWRDALGLAASIALQVGASFHPLITAFFGTLPFPVWLVIRDRLHHASAAQLVVVGAVDLVVVAGFDVLRAPALGVPRTYDWTYETFEPDPEAIAFFEVLEEQGNSGPLLELPVRLDYGHITVDTRQIMLSIFHGRRTSACFGSYQPAGREALRELGARLPEPEAIRALASQGFTTALIEAKKNAKMLSLNQVTRLERAAAKQQGLSRVHLTTERGAYALHPELLAPEAPDTPPQPPLREPPAP
jgi:hypothetical protein